MKSFKRSELRKRKNRVRFPMKARELRLWLEKRNLERENVTMHADIKYLYGEVHDARCDAISMRITVMWQWVAIVALGCMSIVLLSYLYL